MIKWTKDLEEKLKVLVSEGLEDKDIAARLNRTRESIIQKRRSLLLFKRNTSSEFINSAKKRLIAEKERQRIASRNYRLKDPENFKKINNKSLSDKRRKAAINFNNGDRALYWDIRIKRMKNDKRYHGRKAVNITIQDLEKQWLKQNGRCYYTDIDLIAEEPGGRKKTGKLLSIDRVDSKKGYEPDNIAFVSFDLNSMKRDLSHEDFINICKKIAGKFNT